MSLNNQAPTLCRVGLEVLPGSPGRGHSRPARQRSEAPEASARLRLVMFLRTTSLPRASSPSESRSRLTGSVAHLTRALMTPGCDHLHHVGGLSILVRSACAGGSVLLVEDSTAEVLHLQERCDDRIAGDTMLTSARRGWHLRRAAQAVLIGGRIPRSARAPTLRDLPFQLWHDRDLRSGGDVAPGSAQFARPPLRCGSPDRARWTDLGGGDGVAGLYRRASGAMAAHQRL
jgi:hypothetical protein